MLFSSTGKFPTISHSINFLNKFLFYFSIFLQILIRWRKVNAELLTYSLKTDSWMYFFLLENETGRTKHRTNNIENKEEKFKITLSALHRLIDFWKTSKQSYQRSELATTNTEFHVVKLTNRIPRDKAAIISGISVRKIDRGWGSSVKLSILHSTHVLKVTSILESIWKAIYWLFGFCFMATNYS
jgi:hypothetical protein